MNEGRPSIEEVSAAPWIVPLHQPPAWSNSQRVWTLSRYEDTAALLRHPGVAVVDIGERIDRLGQRAGRPNAALLNLLRGILIFRNPPFHTRGRAFAGRSLGALADGFSRERIQIIVDSAIAAACESGRVEAMAGICGRLPVLVMANALGLPPQCVDIVHASGESLLSAAEPGLSLRALAGLDDTAGSLAELIRSEIRAAQRSGNSRLGRILALNAADFGFSEDEIVACVVFLLMAGVETTSAFLGSAILLLLRHPSERRLLRERPELMACCLDEVLRVAGPARRLSARIASVPLQLGGIQIAPGMPVIADIEQAHHDPSAYEQPSRFDLDRRGPPSFSFGAGGRACLGATVARLQASLLLRTLLACKVALLDDVPEWDDNPRIRRLKSLNLSIEQPPSGVL